VREQHDPALGLPRAGPDHGREVTAAAGRDRAAHGERRPRALVLGRLEDLLDEIGHAVVVSRPRGAVPERLREPVQRLRIRGLGTAEGTVGVERISGHRAARRVRPVLERERSDEQRKERWQESGPVHAGIQHLRRG
jgi:hypothetical protein